MDSHTFFQFLKENKDLSSNEIKKFQHYLDLFQELHYLTPPVQGENVNMGTQFETTDLSSQNQKTTAPLPPFNSFFKGKNEKIKEDCALEKALPIHQKITAPLPEIDSEDKEKDHTTNDFQLFRSKKQARTTSIHGKNESEMLFPFEKISFEERYELLENLGEGGMGIVQKFYDHILSREVAQKKIKNLDSISSQSQRNQILRRFFVEAEIMALLEHPNIVPLYDMQQTEEGQQCLIMRKIEGQTLREYLNATPPHSPEWEEFHFLSIFRKVCDAVAYAHSKGIIHRDLKPQNIMLGMFGEVYIMDWGVSKVFGEQILSNEQNSEKYPSFRIETGTIGGIGTVGYIPPEQQNQASTVTPQADIYALGKILRECYTGLAPYEELKLMIKSFEENKANKKEALPANKIQVKNILEIEKKIPLDIRAIIQKATEKESSKRYQTVSEFLQDITKYQQHQKVSALLKADDIEKINGENSIQKQMQKLCGDEHLFPKFLSYFEKKELKKGDYLIKQGEDARELYIIISGLAVAKLEREDNHNVKLRSMGPGSIIGEIGFFLNEKPRTVSVYAGEPIVVYCLSQTSYQIMKEKNPEVAIVLQENIIKTLSTRLDKNSQVIENLMDSD